MSKWVARSGFENRWSDDADVMIIWHEPQFNQIVVDTPGYDGDAGSLDARQAREAAAALLAFADLWDAQASSGEVLA